MLAYARLAALAALVSSPIVSAQLHDLAVAAGLKYFGTALDNSHLSDAALTAIVNDSSEFGQLVPENGQKWAYAQPTEGTFAYASGDVVADLAATNAQVLRCHTLTWHSQLPSWVSAGTWTRDSLTAVIETHIQNVMGHYKGKCYAWDVVNEAVDDSGEWRQSVFFNTLGTDYIPISFNAAKAADPDTKLYYNDYNLEYNGAKTARAREAVQITLDAGAPIDGVGFQGHLIVGSTPQRSALATVLRSFTALGVEVAYTELDIRHASLPAAAAALETQGADFANVVGSCLDVEGCVGVTVWGASDKYSWVESTFPGAGEACLYNAQMERKPAWSSVSSLLAAAAGTGAASQPSAQESSAAATAVATEAPAVTEAAGTSSVQEVVVPTTLATQTSAPAELSSSSVVATEPTAAPPSPCAARRMRRRMRRHQA